MSMNIHDYRNNAEGVEVQKLNDGDTFVYEDELYIMICQSDDSNYECYDLKNTYSTYFHYDMKVTPVDVDLHITRNIPASEYE